MKHHLGRIPSPTDARTLRLANYVRIDATPAPPARLWHRDIPDWGQAGNDKYGNCVIATAAHAILNWRANELKDTTKIADNAVIELSREMHALNGYTLLDRNKWWRNKTMWSDRLWAFMLIDAADLKQVAIAINSFGVADAGLLMPRAWINEKIWDTGSGANYKPNTWGAHSVPIVGYDETYLYLVTWGYVQKITWSAVATYCDECYALIDPNWIAGDFISPSGLDLEKLHADLFAATGRGLPTAIHVLRHPYPRT